MAKSHSQLDKKLKNQLLLIGSLKKNESKIKELLIIMKRPGWTTPAELSFALGILESLNQQLNSVIKLQNELVASSKLVRNIG